MIHFEFSNFDTFYKQLFFSQKKKCFQANLHNLIVYDQNPNKITKSIQNI